MAHAFYAVVCCYRCLLSIFELLCSEFSPMVLLMNSYREPLAVFTTAKQKLSFYFLVNVTAQSSKSSIARSRTLVDFFFFFFQYIGYSLESSDHEKKKSFLKTGRE